MSSNGSHGGADVNRHIAVIGGGIIGASTAFHLLQAGVRQVTLIDAGKPGSATTGAGAGFVSHWSAGMIPLGEEGFHVQQYGLDFYRRLHEVGVEIGYRPNGTLIMALTEEGREQFVRPVLESPYAPAEMQDLDAAQIGRKMQGLVDPAKVHSAAYNPHGIQLDTSLAMGVLTSQIRERGGVVRDGTRVTAVHDDGDGVRIETDKGEIKADAAVVRARAVLAERETANRRQQGLVQREVASAQTGICRCCGCWPRASSPTTVACLRICRPSSAANCAFGCAKRSAP